jgi:ribosome-associated heat shock protein Hsp15
MISRNTRSTSVEAIARVSDGTPRDAPLGSSLRIDKWLWAARFFKTRSAAQQAVEGGKVKLNGERVKPSKEVKAGDRLMIHIGAYEWMVTVARLSDKRGPAAIARTLYAQDEESRVRRNEQAALRRFAGDPGSGREGRPTKRERRQLERWRGR